MPPESDLLSALPLFLLLVILGTAMLMLTRVGASELALFWVAFGIRFAASLTIYEFGLVEIIGDEDAQEWINGWWVKRHWEMYQVGILGLPSVLIEAYDTYNRGYMFFLAAVYTVWDVFDPGRMVAAVINGFAGAMTVTLIYRAARELFDEQAARLAGWLACWFPSLIVWSAQTLKEPIVILLETFLLYMCLRLLRTRTVPVYLLFASIAGLLIIPFRFYGGYLAGAIVGLTLVLRAMMLAASDARRTLGVVGALAGTMIAVAAAIVFTQRESAFDFAYFVRIKDYSSTVGGSSVELPFDLDTPLGFVLSSIVGAVHVVFAPFPWHWVGGSTRLVFTVPEVLAWWVLFYLGVWPGLRRAFRERFVEILPILLFLIGFGFLYGAMFGNVGLAYRQRAQLLPWLLIFGAVGLRDRWDRLSALRRQRLSQRVISREETLPA